MQTELIFNGSDYKPSLDRDRLAGQMLDVYDFMSDQEWHTLEEIHAQTGHPQASVSAQLRHLRKPRFGGYHIEKRRSRMSSGLWFYRLNASNREGEESV